MNKMSYTTIKHSVIVLAGLVLSAHADHRVYVEAKPGYFFLTDSVQQEIFGNGGFDIGAEIGGDVYSICRSACSSLALRVAAAGSISNVNKPLPWRLLSVLLLNVSSEYPVSPVFAFASSTTL